ncbi:hypothetical protein X943_000261 [Babesia divergens]|uniref:Uncharacterized protein n=1 Tax=Babesia divergens TaxID=32595 RepID=A0AAD9GE74_BABDI|nr:hypothetical protein X943_000261 [Babesia divergens]
MADNGKIEVTEFRGKESVDIVQGKKIFPAGKTLRTIAAKKTVKIGREGTLKIFMGSTGFQMRLRRIHKKFHGSLKILSRIRSRLPIDPWNKMVLKGLRI